MVFIELNSSAGKRRTATGCLDNSMKKSRVNECKVTSVKSKEALVLYSKKQLA